MPLFVYLAKGTSAPLENLHILPHKSEPAAGNICWQHLDQMEEFLQGWQRFLSPSWGLPVLSLHSTPGFLCYSATKTHSMKILRILEHHSTGVVKLLISLTQKYDDLHVGDPLCKYKCSYIFHAERPF